MIIFVVRLPSLDRGHHTESFLQHKFKYTTTKCPLRALGKWGFGISDLRIDGHGSLAADVEIRFDEDLREPWNDRIAVDSKRVTFQLDG